MCVQCLTANLEAMKSPKVLYIRIMETNKYFPKLSRKQTFGSPWENHFTPGFVCSQHTAPRNIKLAQTHPSWCTNSHLGRVESRRFIPCALRNSRYASEGFEPRTSRTRYHWTNAPRQYRSHLDSV